MKKYNLFLLCLLWAFSSCTYSRYFLKPEGDIATISTKNNPEIIGELISIQDSVVYILQENTGKSKKIYPEKIIASVSIEKIDSICIQGYSDRDWLKWVIYFEAVPGALLTIAAASYIKETNVAAVFFICEFPALMTYLIFELTNMNTPTESAPYLISKIGNLKKFAKFPQGINEFQMNTLLQKFNQKEIKRIN